MDRRSFMSGTAVVAGASLMVSGPAMASTSGRAEWDAALRRWEAASAEADAFYKANFGDTFDDAADGDNVEMDRLDAIETRSRAALMEMPSPDRAALRWKLNHILEDDASGGITAWNNAYIDQTRRDVARFLGDV